MKTRLWIAIPDKTHNTYGLKIISDNVELVKRFENLCVMKLMQNDAGNLLGTYFQGGHNDPNWKYFEFLKAKDRHGNFILKLAMDIADELNVALEIGEIN